jgi:hypothetical protein
VFDDPLGDLLLIRPDLLFRNREMLVRSPEPDQSLNESRQGLLKNGVEPTAEQGVDPTLQNEQSHREVMEPYLPARRLHLRAQLAEVADRADPR